MRYRIILLLSSIGLLLEKTCNALWSFFTLLILFIAMSIIGIPQALPTFFGVGILVLFFIIATYLLYTGLVEVFSLSMNEVRRKIEKTSGAEHRPLDTVNDSPIQNSPLWDKHVELNNTNLKKLKFYHPHFKISESDHFAVRYMALLVLLISLGTTPHGLWSGRLISAITPKVDVTLLKPAASSIDAWISFPDYTQKKPLFLMSANRDMSETHKINVVKGSVLKIKASNFMGKVSVKFGDESLLVNNNVAEIELKNSGIAKISHIFQKLGNWDIEVNDDASPTAEIKNINKTELSATKITYSAKDDYGIKKLEALFSLKGLADSPIYKFPLNYNVQEETQTHLEDLASHIWSGNEVSFRIRAEDNFGNVSTSAPTDFILPTKQFKNIAARKVIVVRKELMDPKNDNIALAQEIAQVVIRPQLYKGDYVVFMSLSTAIKRIARNDRSEELMQLLWDIAMQLEDGGLSVSQKKLHQALQKLRNLLANEDLTAQQKQEIISEVKAAIVEYLQNLMIEMQNMMMSGKAVPQMSSKLAEKMGSSMSVDDILKKIQSLADADSYKNLSDVAKSLQNSLENFDVEKFEEMQQEQIEALQGMQDLESLIKNQQKLYEETMAEWLPKTITPKQEELIHDLDIVISKLGKVAQKIPENFGNARNSMEDAVLSLNKGEADKAIAHQQNVLKELQKANDAAAEELAKAMKDSMLSLGLLPQGGKYGKNYDPLGRASGNDDEIKIPLQSESRTIRQIIEDLHKRANNPNNSPLEKEYLDRLIP